jgi:hypothetical protein
MNYPPEMQGILVSVTRYKGREIHTYYTENGKYFTRLDGKKNATVYVFSTELRAIEARQEDLDLIPHEDAGR